MSSMAGKGPEMTGLQWTRVEELLAHALTLEPLARRDFLDRECKGDVTLRGEVESLLAAHDRSGPLDHPARELADYLTSAATRPAGTVVSHYEIQARLGMGGMGVVYRARDLRLGRVVALKFLPPILSDNEQAKQRFLSEARAAAALEHVNVCTVHEIGETDEGHLFIAMAFVDGESLREIIERGPLSVDDALRVARQIADGLECAHRHGIVHRDVKPANVMVGPNGVAKIVDFGIAKLAGSTLTVTGATPGTAAYMSPEQASGGDTDRRSDVWALGVVLFEMLTGGRPFPGGNEVAVAHAILTVKPPRVSSLRSDIPVELDAVVERALAKSRGDRFPSAGAFRDALRLTGPQRGTNAAPSLTPRLRRGAVVGLLVLAALVVGAYWRWGRGGFRDIARPAEVRSMAVLPLAALGSDTANAYLADGMTEALINALARVHGLRVTPRSSAFALKTTRLNARQIGETLHVTTILEGSVQRAEDRVRIAVELSDVAHDSTLWSKTYDGDRRDVFGLQDSIAKAVVGKLQADIARPTETLVTRATADPEAYDLYLQGRAIENTFTRDNLLKSIGYFQRALRIDPRFALAYAAIADAYENLADAYMAPREAEPKAKEAALRALALDSSLAETHAELGLILSAFDYDYANGHREVVRALELSPSLAYAHILLASDPMTKPEVAIREVQTARRLDPISASTAFNEMVAYWMRGADTLLVRAAKQNLDADPTNELTAALLALGYAEVGQPDSARMLLRRASCTIGYSCAFEGVAFARVGDRAGALRRVEQLEALSKRQYVPADGAAWIYASLGETDVAIRWLTRAVDERSAPASLLTFTSVYDTLRSDPRFAALVRRVGAPVPLRGASRVRR